MRPDFGQTYARSVARFGGTLVGVAPATGSSGWRTRARTPRPGSPLSARSGRFCRRGPDTPPHGPC
ncbi:hypothetical protein [Streptomyces sp. TRM49041]|uniref:hypothetical protein n=1 Tax=Streptomyces sp. TRM49041 TaxID=2603216 RepID=UPI0037DA1521